jgi:hypothetical protein
MRKLGVQLGDDAVAGDGVTPAGDPAAACPEPAAGRWLNGSGRHAEQGDLAYFHSVAACFTSWHLEGTVHQRC